MTARNCTIGVMVLALAFTMPHPSVSQTEEMHVAGVIKGIKDLHTVFVGREAELRKQLDMLLAQHEQELTEGIEKERQLAQRTAELENETKVLSEDIETAKGELTQAEMRYQTAEESSRQRRAALEQSIADYELIAGSAKRHLDNLKKQMVGQGAASDQEPKGANQIKLAERISDIQNEVQTSEGDLQNAKRELQQEQQQFKTLEEESKRRQAEVKQRIQDMVKNSVSATVDLWNVRKELVGQKAMRVDMESQQAEAERELRSRTTSVEKRTEELLTQLDSAWDELGGRQLMQRLAEMEKDSKAALAGIGELQKESEAKEARLAEARTEHEKTRASATEMETELTGQIAGLTTQIGSYTSALEETQQQLMEKIRELEERAEAEKKREAELAARIQESELAAQSADVKIKELEGSFKKESALRSETENRYAEIERKLHQEIERLEEMAAMKDEQLAAAERELKKREKLGEAAGTADEEVVERIAQIKGQYERATEKVDELRKRLAEQLRKYSETPLEEATEPK